MSSKSSPKSNSTTSNIHETANIQTTYTPSTDTGVYNVGGRVQVSSGENVAVYNQFNDNVKKSFEAILDNTGRIINNTLISNTAQAKINRDSFYDQNRLANDAIYDQTKLSNNVVLRLLDSNSNASRRSGSIVNKAIQTAQDIALTKTSGTAGVTKLITDKIVPVAVVIGGAMILIKMRK